jgi:hypothetical protein
MSVYDNVLPHLFNINTSNGRISWNNDYSVRGKLTIPYQIGNTKVTGIEDNGFNGNSRYKSGMIGVTHIFWSDKNGAVSPSFTILGNGSSIDYSFANLSNLVYFQMPETITTIPNYCFNGCTSLFKGEFSSATSVNYAVEKAFKNITTVMSLAFTNVPITDLTIPSKMQTLGRRSFRNMTGLTTITINSTNLNYDDCGIEIFDGNEDTLIKVTMPSQYDTAQWLDKFDFGAPEFDLT